ncbi:MAG: HYR domain-containing protein [Chitinophagaceae bacterium]|nr:HYR domain-containing protein [Chitinophagaceae bacterium]
MKKTLLMLVALFSFCASWAQKPVVSKAAAFAVSAPARDFGIAKPEAGKTTSRKFVGDNEGINKGNEKRIKEIIQGLGGETGKIQSTVSENFTNLVSAPITSFDGNSSADNFAAYGGRVYPPDANGDVGPNHYVQTTNLLVGIFNKTTGALVIPKFKMSTLFASLGPPFSTTDNGDPIVLYDQLADRWLISQFLFTNVSGGVYYQVIAISQTGDPTGAYYVYAFLMPNNKLNDYPHFGVWPDGYYMADNQFTNGASFSGAGAFAFDRAKMLVGDPTASYIYFDQAASCPSCGGQLPTDIEGFATPPIGTPNLFMEFRATEYGDPVDGLRIFAFHADFATPANSTFTQVGGADLPLGAFDARNPSSRADIEQPAPSTATTYLDGIADRLMHRLSYRILPGGVQSFVGNFTVNVSGVSPISAASYQAGIKWFELRRSAAGVMSVNDEGIYAPGAANGASGRNIWMAGIAQDGEGNLGLGFSASSTTLHPSILYTGRLTSDPPGTMGQGENTLVAGSGVQLGTANRWGDYSSMSVDPVDECTFWYTQEYYTAASQATSTVGWLTRIGSFKVNPNCVVTNRGTISGTVTNCITGLPIANAVVTTPDGFFTKTNAAGQYSILAASGSYTVVISLPNSGYNNCTSNNVIVTNGGNTVVNCCLGPSCTSPVITASNIGPVSNAPNTCGALVTMGTNLVITGDQPITVTYSLTNFGATISNPYTFPVGTTTVWAKASNTCGDDIKSFTVTVNDGQPPVITCPANITQASDPNICGAVVNFNVTATDNCPSPRNISQSTNSNTIVQFNTVSCNTGAPGYINRDNSYYRKYDLAAMGITGPYTIKKINWGIETAAPFAGKSANKQATSSGISTNSGGFAKGDNPTSSIVQSVTLKVYTLTGPFILANLTQVASETVSINTQSQTLISTTLTSPPTVPANSTIVLEIFTPDGTGAGTSIFVASNNLGQSAPSYIRANDCGVTQPTDLAGIGFPGVHLILNAEGEEGPTVVSTPPSGSLFPVGTTTVNSVATDVNGNTANCSFTVTVQHPILITAPTVTQPTCELSTGTIVVNATGNSTLEYSVDNGATYQASASFSGLVTGNYNIKVRLQSSPSCEAAYTNNPVVLSEATGCCVPPIITAPSVTQPTCATPTGTIVVNATGNSTLEYSVDNGATYQASATFSGLATGNYNITVRIQSSPLCEAAYANNPVVLSEATGCCVPPTITAPTVTQPTCATPTGTIVVNATGNSTLEYSVDNGATYQVSATFSGLAPGNYNIKVRIQNNQTCTTAYAGNPVVLNAAAIFACPGNMVETITNQNNPCFKAVNTPNPVFCGTLTKLTWKLTGATVLSSPTSGINYLGLRNMNVGTTTVTYTATFTGSIVRTCSFTVLVIETVPPNIYCPLDKNVTTDVGKCYRTGPVSLGTPVVNDNCGIASVTNNAPAVYQKGENLVTWTVTDKSGNIRTCVQKVTVYDAERPTITCPVSLIVNADPGPGCGKAQLSLPLPVFNDNCGVVTLTWAMVGVTYGSSGNTGINYVPTMNYLVGISTITYTAIDEAGNSRTCTFRVTVKDVTAPLLVCPPAETFCKVANNTYSIPALVQSDNCVIVSTTFKITGATSRTGSGTNASGIFNLGVSTILWTVKDSHGNISTCTTVITVVATSNPICTPPPFTVKGNNPKFTETVVPGLSITAWPNPSVNYFNLKVTSQSKENVLIKMYDMAGKLVQVKRGAAGDNYILGEGVVSGMYFIEVSQGDKTARTKVVKQ